MIAYLEYSLYLFVVFMFILGVTAYLVRYFPERRTNQRMPEGYRRDRVYVFVVTDKILEEGDGVD